MTTTELPSARAEGDGAFPLTWTWLLKRSALWVIILAAGVSGACLLYAAAGFDSAERPGISPAAAATKIKV